MFYFDSFYYALKEYIFDSRPTLAMTAVFSGFFLASFELFKKFCIEEDENLKEGNVRTPIENFFLTLVIGLILAVIFAVGILIVKNFIVLILGNFFVGVLLSLFSSYILLWASIMVLYLKNIFYIPFTKEIEKECLKREEKVLQEYGSKIRNLPQSEYVQNINNAISDYFDKIDKYNKVPKKYADLLNVVALFKQYFDDGRVDSIKEAINLYEKERKETIRHQERMNLLNQQNKIIAEAKKQQNDILEEAKENQKRAHRKLESDSQQALSSIKNQERDIESIKDEIDS